MANNSSPRPVSTTPVTGPSQLRRRVGAVAGVAVGVGMLLMPTPEGLEPEAWRVAAVAMWMALWWMTEAIPIAATSLLPIVALPLLDVADVRSVAAPYANPLIFLFLGGFLIAIALQQVGLHRRLALSVLARVGSSPRRLVLGFMVASAALSMWISNTATALMMLPIALSVIDRVGASRVDHPSAGDVVTDPEPAATNDSATAMLLGVAYACSLGGMATLVGTPTNALLAAYLLESYELRIGFSQWLSLALPLVIFGLALTYGLLTRLLFMVGDTADSTDGAAALLAQERRALGRLSSAEWRVAVVFAATASAWMLRPILARRVDGLTDTGIALIGALALFLWPARGEADRGGSAWRPVLDAGAFQRLPWGVLLLFGGGLSLASSIQSSGLATWIGGHVGRLDGSPLLLILLATVALVVFLTELTSNTATAAAFLPVLASIALGLGQNPLLLVVPATLAASCAFMLPVATPPNAIVYGSGRISVSQMARGGLWLNLIFVALLTVFAYTALPIILGVEFGVVPTWAR